MRVTDVTDGPAVVSRAGSFGGDLTARWHWRLPIALTALIREMQDARCCGRWLGWALVSPATSHSSVKRGPSAPQAPKHSDAPRLPASNATMQPRRAAHASSPSFHCALLLRVTLTPRPSNADPVRVLTPERRALFSQWRSPRSWIPYGMISIGARSTSAQSTRQSTPDFQPSQTSR